MPPQAASAASISTEFSHSDALYSSDSIEKVSFLLKQTNRSTVDQEKPPKIRGTGKVKDKLGASKKREEHVGGTCGVSVQVGKHDDKTERCPKDCPYYVQEKPMINIAPLCV